MIIDFATKQPILIEALKERMKQEKWCAMCKHYKKIDEDNDACDYNISMRYNTCLMWEEREQE